MSYEFKSIADVEVVAEPSKSANVLIEENGIIKKAPKTAVGGVKSEWDARIFYDSPTGELFFLEGEYKSIYGKIENKEMPKISLFAHLKPSGEFYEIYTASGVFMWDIEYGEQIQLKFYGCSQNPTIYLNSDNSMEFSWN